VQTQVLFLEISFNPLDIRVPLFVGGLVLAFVGVHLINSLKEEDSSGQVALSIVEVDKPSVEFSGLKWLNIGNSLPTNGRQLENLRLASALTRGGKADIAVLRSHLGEDPARACTQEFSQVFFLHRMCSLYIEFGLSP
jgi:hypothetical protein